MSLHDELKARLDRDDPPSTFISLPMDFAASILSALKERDAMREALKSVWPSNLATVPDYLPDDFVFPLDISAGELRNLRQALKSTNA